MATPAASTFTQPIQPPAYLLDILEWKIKPYSVVSAAADQRLNTEGYGIISYAWGKWHSKSKYAVAGGDYPTFDIGNESKGKPFSWIFPIVNEIDASKTATAGRTVFSDKPQFTVVELKKALGTLGVRYIWWDWACIPQGWDWDHVTQETRGPEFQVHQELLKVKDQEIDKMRYMYPASTRGCLWWHQTKWARSVQSMIAGPVEAVLQTIESIKGKGMASIDVATIEKYTQQVETARLSEQSLQSLWSFQEGVLFASLRRPQIPSGGSTLDMPSVILDRNGNPTKSAGAVDHASVFMTGQADLSDLNAMASTMAIQLAGALLDLGRPKEERVTKFDIGKSEADARCLLSRLTNTGLVALVYDNPLPPLEARFGRTFELWNSDVDISVNTLVGPMGVEMAPEQESARAVRADWEQTLASTIDARAKSANKTVPDMQKQDKADVAAGILNILKVNFMTKIVALYQWRMLLFARGGGKTRSSNLGSAFWLSLIGRDRPTFSALEVYLGADQNLSQIYGPGAKQPATLPQLAMVPTASSSKFFAQSKLYLQSQAAYRYYSFKAADAKQAVGWTSCVCYDYVNPAQQPASGPQVAGTVAAKQVNFADRNATFGPNDIVLLPIEPASGISKESRTRCAILSDYSATDREGVFWGIGDFGGLPKIRAGAVQAPVFARDKPISIL